MKFSTSQKILIELQNLGYSLEELNTRKPIAMNIKTIEKICPKGGSINMLLSSI